MVVSLKLLGWGFKLRCLKGLWDVVLEVMCGVFEKGF